MKSKFLIIALVSAVALIGLSACSDNSAVNESAATESGGVNETKVALDVAAVGEEAVVVAPALATQICGTESTPTAPTENYGFVEGEERIVVDNGYKRKATMWMRCALGQKWDSQNKTCTGEPKLFAWHEVHQLAAKYNEEEFGGLGQWRVPFLPELMTLRETNCSNPAMNIEVFAGAPAVFFWSSMPAVDDLTKSEFSKDEAYGTDFVSGGFRREKISKLGAVRLMHDGAEGAAWQSPFVNKEP
ncbi:MAG: DUF1566 domain-containing protein [Gammaproteobacteria bacterium]|nr:DUF1566 domain-containing protein [Gammaproteobacteria bacterium]